MVGFILSLVLSFSVYANCFQGFPEHKNTVSYPIKDKAACLKECNEGIDLYSRVPITKAKAYLMVCTWNGESLPMSLKPVKPSSPEVLKHDQMWLQSIVDQHRSEHSGKECKLINIYAPKIVMTKWKHSSELACRYSCEDFMRGSVSEVKPHMDPDHYELLSTLSCHWDGKAITYETALPKLTPEKEAKLKEKWAQYHKRREEELELANKIKAKSK